MRSYFKATPNPDCNRLMVMSAAYMAMDNDKQPAAKAQVYGLMNVLSKTCQPYQIDTLKMMVK